VWLWQHYKKKDGWPTMTILQVPDQAERIMKYSFTDVAGGLYTDYLLHFERRISVERVFLTSSPYQKVTCFSLLLRFSSTSAPLHLHFTSQTIT
jgi:hypothetical protein